MQRRIFGAAARELGIIGQGTWNLERARRADAVLTLQRGLDLGMQHIDTAEMYGDGAAESLVGEAIRGRRDEVFLVSKVLPEHATFEGTRAACAASLKRLGTSHLDCYLLHWRGRVPLAETLRALDALQQEGRILSFGVSNFDLHDLNEALHLLGPGRLACNQVLYHLQQRAIEHAVLPWCVEHGVALVAYSPYGHDDFPTAGSTGGKVLAGIAAAHEATPRQVALSFLCRQAGTFAIPKTARLAHADENAGGGSLQLSAAETARIDAAFPRGRKPAWLPTL